MNQLNWKMQWKQWIGVALAFAALLVFMPALHAQTTATLSGTVTDASGAVIPGAQVTVTNVADGSARQVTSDGAGFFSFPALDPGTYNVKASAKGFNAKEITGIVLHAGDQRGIASIPLAVGTATQTVTVQAAAQIIPVENGAHGAVLDYHDIQNIVMFGQDSSELLKDLPGVTTSPNGLSGGPMHNDEYVNVDSSFIGQGLIANGVPYRGGTLQLVDGVDIDDPGCDCNAIAIVLPEFTQEMNVQTSNYGADAQYGPVVINTTSRSGGSQYHGTAFFYAGNDALNANDWLSKHNGVAKGSAHRYYPGGDIGGPVPFTHKKLFGWFGYERLLQNEGNANTLQSSIPTPAMMAGNFTATGAGNNILCPNGFSAGSTGTWCGDVSQNTFFYDGSQPTTGDLSAYTGAQQFPMNAGARTSLSSFWPQVWNSDGTPNTAGGFETPSSTNGYIDYFKAIVNIDDGWIWRGRLDYSMSDKTKIFVSYQQGHDSALANGNGAHIYWTPGGAIPFPGGGLFQNNYSKAAAGHFVHVFNATTTNELIAAWGYGSFPQAAPSPTAAYRTTLNYPGYSSVFNGVPSASNPNASSMIPSYNGAGRGYPDFSQTDFFHPTGLYTVKKEMPSFTDNFTKVWGAHTVKMGAFTENVDNLQDPFSQLNGIFSFGESTNIVTGNTFGSNYNPTANFLLGSATGYAEWSKAPIQDLAYQDTSFYVDDSWKVNSRLSMEIGTRFDHVGHWYDRQQTGIAVFEPNLVLSDWESGKSEPGVYWHGINPGIPDSGQPNRLAFISPRFGFSWDILGNGKTVVRGGWGAYRYSDQYNDSQGALQTAQDINIYGLPGQKAVWVGDLGSPAVQKTVPVPAPKSQAGSVGTVSPTDYGIPLTYSYNLTIDRQLPWNSLLEVAYVGNASSQLTMGGEGIEGSTFNSFVNQNKTPMGAFFLPDPITGVISNNPENIGHDRTTGNSNGNNIADYRPFGYAYGTNNISMNTNVGYQNYNGLQVSWEKRAGRLSFNLNGTWSKTLATSQQRDPFVLHNNYGPDASNRAYVFNSTYIYSIGNLYHGSAVIQEILNGWQISGQSTWQSGGYLPVLLGNGVPNFGLSLNYVNVPQAISGSNEVGSGLGGNTYFGTDAGQTIMQNLVCNPNSGLGAYQHANLSCFAPPAVKPGTNGIAWVGAGQGGNAWPYMSGPSYFSNDLALYKTFQIRGTQNVQFRLDVFNWLNHALASFSGQNPLNQIYNVDYNTGAIAINQASGETYSNALYGKTDVRLGAPYQRILLLTAKYNF
jgi:hypothetical protein